jgi:hypothetical protein
VMDKMVAEKSGKLTLETWSNHLSVDHCQYSRNEQFHQPNARQMCMVAMLNS